MSRHRVGRIAKMLCNHNKSPDIMYVDYIGSIDQLIDISLEETGRNAATVKIR